MTRQQALARIVGGIDADLAAYLMLQGLLERQFQAVLRHQSSTLEALSGEVTRLVDQLAARRDERCALVQGLLGAGGTLEGVLALLPKSQRPGQTAAWKALEAAVLRCKQANTRNCEVLMAQHSLMQRVLHGEEHLYEPA